MKFVALLQYTLNENCMYNSSQTSKEEAMLEMWAYMEG